jgi:hypothetical protein
MGSNAGNPPQDFNDRRLDQESAAHTRELDLKEREVAAREKEVATKAAELKSSRWANPLVLGLFAAALALIGNILVAHDNASSAESVG